MPPADALAFVWAECEMLDAQNYDPWLQLWTAEGRYVVPVDREVTDFADHLNIVFDDHAMRLARIKRLQSGFSMSSAPAARTVRTVSRFSASSDGEKLRLRAAMQLVEFKYQRTRLLAGELSYSLIRRDGELRLDEKVVRLINSDDALHGIGYLL
jgi:3-phenylpropionate/cinnamic acid dioxygenase small subunit